MTGFALPEDAVRHVVHYAGGQFLVSWSTGPGHNAGRRALWSGRPEEVFVPERSYGLRPYGAVSRAVWGTSSRPGTAVAATTGSASCGPAAQTEAAAVLVGPDSPVQRAAAGPCP
ncbi:hypothetical protein ACFWFZ_27495 [Streptomyces sp. NPDC060232]|uniref:hypothetical protein n=1 Tax=Streptomyces sp. NPDC060232 TaxID=3347079 RepID=UPI00365C8154